jgi:hypothetical protein
MLFDHNICKDITLTLVLLLCGGAMDHTSPSSRKILRIHIWENHFRKKMETGKSFFEKKMEN